jgi:predicted dehydrogenase
VHICTPAADHASTLRAATCAGFRRIIVEKPCAANTADVEADRTGASIGVINPYLYSRSVPTPIRTEAFFQLPHVTR